MLSDYFSYTCYETFQSTKGKCIILSTFLANELYLKFLKHFYIHYFPEFLSII